MSTKAFLSHWFPQTRKNLGEFCRTSINQNTADGLEKRLCSLWSGSDPGRIRERSKSCQNLRTKAELVRLGSYNFLCLLVRSWIHTWPLPRGICFWDMLRDYRNIRPTMTILQSILILYFFQRTKRAMQSRFLMVFDQKKKKKKLNVGRFHVFYRIKPSQICTRHL